MRRYRRDRKRVDERLHTVYEIEVVIQQLGCRWRRSAVIELQRPETTLDPVRRQDRLPTSNGEGTLSSCRGLTVVLLV